jgi:hypothetical protein
MAMMTKKELEKVVDFARLKKANGLLLKWAVRFDICKNKFVRWVSSLNANAEEHKNKLPINMRSAFVKDCKVMFYASEIQSILVEQYSQMVHQTLSKIRIPQDTNQYDEFYNEGLLAIVYASWSFRQTKSKCSFTTFVFNTINMRLKGNKFKDYKKAKRRSDKVAIYTEAEKDENFNLAEMSPVKDSEPEIFVEPVNKVVDRLIEVANLDEADAFMLRAYANRKEIVDKTLWHTEFTEKYAHTFMFGRVTKQGLQQRMKRLQKRLWSHYKKIYGDPIPA